MIDSADGHRRESANFKDNWFVWNFFDTVIAKKSEHAVLKQLKQAILV